MMYDSLLSRSFSKHEQKKLKYGGFIICLLLVFSFCTILKPYLDPFLVLNLRLSIGAPQKLHILDDTNSSQQTVRDLTTSNTASNNTSISEKVNTKILRKNNETIATTTSDTSESLEKVREIKTSAKNNTSMVNHNSPQQIVSDENMAREKKTWPAMCKIMERSDFCEIKGDIKIDSNSSTIFIASSEMDILAATNTTWNIRPYARKGDLEAMSLTREWTVKMVKTHRKSLQCTQIHNVSGILFSLGGYSGNHFHAFTDIVLPLFLTARPFNRDVKFLVTNKRPPWIAKFKTLLDGLSKYEVIDIDNRSDVHCFSSIRVGLKRETRKELSINHQSELGYSMKDFRQFLRSSYSLRKTTAMKVRDVTENNNNNIPRLLIISRKRSRAFINHSELAEMAKSLGYQVVVFEPDADLSKSAEIVNSCDVMLGVHGAGLTNMVFLPENAILIQVVPFGGAEWVSKNYFEEPSKDMNIRYLEYKISIEESSLINQYPADHVVLRNPSVIQKKGWLAFKSTYFDRQNVRIDLNRFRPTLLKALELLQQ